MVRSTVKASQVLQDELQKFVESGKVTIHLNTSTDEIIANEAGQVVEVTATKDGEKVSFSIDGVFVFIGLKPNTQFLAGSGVELDGQGLVKTNEHLATNMVGVYASGDVRSGATMQIASAVGEGAAAALNIREFLDGLKRPS